MCEMLASLEAPVFIERIALGNNKQIMNAAKVLRKAVENQVKGLGFSFIEVLSPCPTIWKLDPIEAQRYVREEMAKIFPVGNFRDRTKDGAARPAPAPAPGIDELPRLLGLTNGNTAIATGGPAQGVNARIRIAGFGGQGVLMLGEVLAEAGLAAGHQVSWLPSYGPEMRSGTSNCHVRLSSDPIDSPIVSRPNVLVAMNEPSLRKFIATVEPGGTVLYNSPTLPDDCARPDVRVFPMPFTEMADQLGASKAANIIMLGALLEATDLLAEEPVTAALKHKVKSQKWFEIDIRAMQRGRQAVRDLV
jgi:2-oxoisovalerate ferredoxin oxidoreductase beta subunit